jgi:hypothetical protein
MQADNQHTTNQPAPAGAESPAVEAGSQAFEFTAELVRNLLSEHVFREKGRLNQLRMPSKEQLVFLANRLSELRVNFRVATESKQQYVPVSGEFLRTFEKLRLLLPEMLHLQTALVRELEQFPPVHQLIASVGAKPQQSRWEMGEALSGLISHAANSYPEVMSACKESINYLTWLVGMMGDGSQKHITIFDNFHKAFRDGFNLFGDWHLMAPQTYDALKSALADANPKLDLGTSLGGPAVRFVAAVLPLITGAAPTEANVRTALMRTKKKTEKKAPNNPAV